MQIAVFSCLLHPAHVNRMYQCYKNSTSLLVCAVNIWLCAAEWVVNMLPVEESCNCQFGFQLRDTHCTHCTQSMVPTDITLFDRAHPVALYNACLSRISPAVSHRVPSARSGSLEVAAAPKSGGASPVGKRRKVSSSPHCCSERVVRRSIDLSC